MQRRIAPGAEHVLDWLHVGMRFEQLKQVAKGISDLNDGGRRAHALAEIERAKWRFWNGYTERGILRLGYLGQWALTESFEHVPSMRRLGMALDNLTLYLESHADSIPDYGKRYREIWHRHRLRRIRSQRDNREANGEEVTDAVEPLHGSALH